MCRAALSFAFILALGLPLVGCGEGDSSHEFTDIREQATSPGLVPPGTTSAERFGMRPASKGHAHGGDPHAGLDMGAGHGARSAPYTWTTPEAWDEVKGHSMRAGSWRVKGEDQTDCSLSMLPGRAGSMLDNVNRWCKQMGTDVMTAEQVKALPRKKMLGQDAVFVNLVGRYGGMGGMGGAPIAEARMLGMLLELPNGALFLKFTGPAKVVEANQGAFEKLAASVKAAKPSAHTKPPAKRKSPADMYKWSLPKGWGQRPPKSMRLVTVAPAGADTTECYLTILGGDGGGLVDNINRWQRQMGQKALTADEVGKLESFPLLGARAVVVRILGTFRGMGGKALDDATMFGMVCQQDGHVLFAKMYGPTATMDPKKDGSTGEWANFVQFCKSITK